MTSERLSLSCPRCGGIALNWRAVLPRRESRPERVEMECPKCGFTWTEAFPARGKENENERKS
jgi:DNA-directed RNA polymerase subunit M/transcription elongation factor TFIIS